MEKITLHKKIEGHLPKYGVELIAVELPLNPRTNKPVAGTTIYRCLRMEGNYPLKTKLRTIKAAILVIERDIEDKTIFLELLKQELHESGLLI